MVRVFSGPNGFVLRRAVEKEKDKFIKQNGDLALEVIDAEEVDFTQIIEAIQAVPFLAEKKLVIVRDLGAVKEIGDKIEQLVDSAKTGNDLIIVEPKPDKRSAYFKYLKSNTELIEHKELDERELANWLIREAKENNASLGFADASYLVRRVGVNQESLYNELNKLINYDKKLTRETIDLLSEPSPQSNIFNLLDSAFSGNHKKTMAIYDEQRVQGEEPLKIFAMIIWQMHLVALVDSAKDQSDEQIMKIGNLKPFTLRKSKSIAGRMGREKIKQTLTKLVELDKRLKYTSVDADDALKNLLVSIS